MSLRLNRITMSKPYVVLTGRFGLMKLHEYPDEGSPAISHIEFHEEVLVIGESGEYAEVIQNRNGEFIRGFIHKWEILNDVKPFTF